MATRTQTVDFILDQLSDLVSVSARKMFGDYELWFDGKLVAVICRDQLFLKITAAGRALTVDPVETPPYPGAKPSLLIDAGRWDDREWLGGLIQKTAYQLPTPAPKRPKRARQ
ncbi:TfoX/Sxy family protein [Methylocystis heyeri]|uniref:Competence protein TfoX n=1 Tax=Methylocystis heyeri TaxID=391905 RepID=A0A6B8KJL5_9HYPH|nr:TfoX/Sxy family protein [Methylocystis heyeri]QGM46788.1 competence protein TfoX [Methylocystis heyeri]